MENNKNKYDFLLAGGAKGVLLIHGITGTPSEMNFLGRRLNKAGFTVMCNTLPGHCGSLGELKKVTWGEIADFCIRDLARLKEKCAQVFVGGLSMGALMAVHLAYKSPQDVRGIIALAPTLFYDGWALSKGKVLLNLAFRVPLLRNNINIRESTPYGLKDEYLRRHFERFYKDAKSNEPDDKVVMFGSPFFPLACLYQHQLFVKVVKKEIPSVKTPILLLHAKEDDMASHKNSLYVLNNIASEDKALILLEDSYHMITIDQEKEKVAQESIKFINKL